MRNEISLQKWHIEAVLYKTEVMFYENNIIYQNKAGLHSQTIVASYLLIGLTLSTKKKICMS